MSWRTDSCSLATNSSDSDSASIVSLKSTFIDVSEPKTVLRRTNSCPDQEIYGSPASDLFTNQKEYVDTLWGRAQSVCNGGGARSECSTPSSSSSNVFNRPQPFTSSPTGYAPSPALDGLPGGNGTAVNSQASHKHRESSLRVASKKVASSNKGLSRALATIEELPQQLEEALQQKVVAAVTDMKGSLLELCSHIQATALTPAGDELATQLAVERIGRIPDQIMQEISGTVSEVKESIEARMESFVMHQAKPEGSLDQEALVTEMKKLPTQVEEIARHMVDSSIDDSALKAVAQMDKALAALPSRGTQVTQARNQVMANLQGSEIMNSMSLVAEEVAKTNVKGAIATARGNKSCTSTDNKSVANLIMSSKTEMTHERRHNLDSESHSQSMKTSWKAHRSSTSMGGGAPTPLAAHKLQLGGSCSSSSVILCQCSENPGSIGHPEMCKKPCLFFQAGQCKQTTNCSFCHLDHPKRANHLDKRNRELLTKLPVAFRVKILIQAMRTRAQQLPYEQAANQFVETLEQQCSGQGCIDDPKFQFDKGFHRLRGALMGQVFSSLVSLFFKMASDELEPSSVAGMKQAFAFFQTKIGRWTGNDPDSETPSVI